MNHIIDQFYFNMLSHPWVLLLLAAVAILLVVEFYAGAPGALAISTGETLARIRGGASGLARRVPALLRALGLSLLVLALARPLHGYELRRDRANVRDIMLCVDVSGSMLQTDFEVGGRYLDRLYVAKEAVRDFINSRKSRAEDRFGLDRLGLVLYAGFAWTQCPLTLDYAVLERELDLAQVDERDPRKNGTAIGSAIGLAVRRLSQSEAESKVIILLTDGLNNRGELDPVTAANVAKQYGIRVYTIGAGRTAGGRAPMGRGQFVAAEIDEASLRQIAGATGGKYYRATDMASLQEAYEEINQLETTEIEVGDYYEYKEAFVPYLALGALLLGLAVFGRRQWCEPIP